MTAVDEAQWPVLARFDVYNQLKLWSGHGAGGQTVRAAEEVERSMLLKQVRRASERELLARKLERGALRRMRYVHWAAAQLLSAAPVLPLHEARVEMETEMTWASDGERAAPFTLLRPLLLMHFDAVLPIFLLCAHNDDVVHAALFEAALFQPLDADAAETCAAVRYLKMAAAALDAPPADELSAVHVSAAEMDASLNDNAAAVLFWAFLFLVAPERTFRRDALGVIYAMLHEFGLKLGEEDGDQAGGRRRRRSRPSSPRRARGWTSSGSSRPSTSSPRRARGSGCRRRRRRRTGRRRRAAGRRCGRRPNRRRRAGGALVDRDAVAAAEPARRHEPRAARRASGASSAPPQLVEPGRRMSMSPPGRRSSGSPASSGRRRSRSPSLSSASRAGRDRSHTEQEPRGRCTRWWRRASSAPAASEAARRPALSSRSRC